MSASRPTGPFDFMAHPLRKMKLLLFLLVAFAPIAFSQQQEYSQTLTAAGVTSTIFSNCANHTVEIVTTGAVSACAVQLEGSLDGTNCENLSGTQPCTSTPAMFHVDGKTLRVVRVNLTSFVGGTNATIYYKGTGN